MQIIYRMIKIEFNFDQNSTIRNKKGLVVKHVNF